MRHITTIASKLLIALACTIILVHAFVPHHHHDSCGTRGIVFEDEVGCHCDSEALPCHQCHDRPGQCHHHSGTHHPFDLCKLQDLLSQLVLSHKEDETYLALSAVAEHELFMTLEPSAISCECPVVDTPGNTYLSPQSVLPVLYVKAALPLRAPPQC